MRCSYTRALASPLGRTGYGRFRSCVATVIRKQWSDHIGRGCLVGPAAAPAGPTTVRVRTVGTRCPGALVGLPVS